VTVFRPDPNLAVYNVAKLPPLDAVSQRAGPSDTPIVTTLTSPAKSAPRRKRSLRLTGRQWKLYVLVGLAGPCVVLTAVLGYYYVVFSRMIDARIHGEMQRVDPRVFARPFALRRGQSITPRQLVDRLNELGYANRAQAEQPGEFTVGRDVVVIIPRDGDRKGQTVRVAFGARSAKTKDPSAVDFIEVSGTKTRPERFTLDAPLITALITSGREKRRDVPLQLIPQHMVQAVLAIEDRRFYDHVGVDPIGIASALWGYAFGNSPYLRGGSTLTQQMIKNTFLTQERSIRRKLLEQFMAVILERRLTKDQILELYMNDVWLGQRGSFAIHGVAEASRLFFAKHISNVSLSEAALIAGTIQSPARHSPFDHPDRAKERRNVVLRAMVEAGFISADAAERTSLEPLTIVPRALEAEAPYFVDYISQELQDRYSSVASTVDVYTTLDLHLQRLAHDVVRDGLVKVDEMLAKRRRQKAQAALIAVDPRTGEVLALVGGRSYNQSQYNRAISAKRQPGSVFKPFVYLAAFEHAYNEGRTDITPATVVMDEPTTFEGGDQPWEPGNYENEYDGPITLRRALALSRNIATIKVAETTGYGEIASLWRRIGSSTARPYPAIALGVFEATPFEIAAAYTLFPNGGTIRPLRAISRLVSAGNDVRLQTTAPKTVARRDTTFLVINMMRSVLNEGTGAGARAAGFAADAAGKSGTTNDLRDAWFVGFTPELLTVVWVGLDDNQPLGLSGTKAALPMWTNFMARAIAGRESPTFQVPEGITFVDIDRDTGLVAGPACPRVFSEAFLQGTEPKEMCHLHMN
jgi:penicillin-binding protein 1B